MKSLPPDQWATRPDAASDDSARAGTMAESVAGATSAARPDANVTIVVSKLIAMGVNVSFKPRCAAGESPVHNDEGQRGLPQAGHTAR
jgi:hypothetical protein